MTKFEPGTAVQWKWYGSLIEGVVEEVFTTRVVRELKGSRIVRNGSPENPAYLVRSDAGNQALKLGSELAPRAKVFKGSPP